MACIQPLAIKWKLHSLPVRFRQLGHYAGTQFYIDVPCGWCLNCRVDRRNWLEDAINYELKTIYHGVGSFVCLTYDNNHIQDLAVTSVDNPFMAPQIVYNSSGTPTYTLRKKHFVDFIKRFRSYINYHLPFGVSPELKIIYCCEYGGKYQRPHAHFIFLGCDYRLLYPILQKCWKNGIIDCGPLENGGIRYVLDYIEKQVHGTQAKKIYEDNGLEAPCMHYSKGLGKSLILDNLPFIMSHDLQYQCGPFQKLRPIPSYYRRLLLSHSKNTNQNKVDRLNYYSSQIGKKKPRSLKEYNELQHYIALQREKHLIHKVRDSGTAFDETYLYNLKSYTHPSFSDLADKALTLSTIYKNFNVPASCIVGNDIPF